MQAPVRIRASGMTIVYTVILRETKIKDENCEEMKSTCGFLVTHFAQP